MYLSSQVSQATEITRTRLRASSSPPFFFGSSPPPLLLPLLFLPDDDWLLAAFLASSSAFLRSTSLLLHRVCPSGFRWPSWSFFFFFETTFFRCRCLARSGLRCSASLAWYIFFVFETLVDDDADHKPSRRRMALRRLPARLIEPAAFDPLLRLFDPSSLFDARFGFHLRTPLISSMRNFSSRARRSCTLSHARRAFVRRRESSSSSRCRSSSSMARPDRLFLDRFCSCLSSMNLELVERKRSEVFATIRHTKNLYTGPDNSPVFSIIVQMRRASVHSATATFSPSRCVQGAGGIV